MTQVDCDYRQENVLKDAVDTFCETIAVKVRLFRSLVPKNTNSELTGQFIEEVVKGFIQNWIGQRLYLTGTLYSDEFRKSLKKPLQIDGIVYDPTAGPTTLNEGNFVIAHPVFCSSIIEVKTTCDEIKEFQKRLLNISNIYMHHVPASCVMGVVIADSDAERTSKFDGSKERPMPLYTYNFVGYCPIFILFSEKGGEYKPHKPAIEAMIRAIYDKQHTLANFI